jgi:mono/diheme cytochrome c family protein
MKNIIKICFTLSLGFLLACNSNPNQTKQSETKSENSEQKIDSSKVMHNDELYKAKTGVGPIKDKVELDSQIDKKMASNGKELFNNACASCHRIKEKSVGPGLGGVLQKRSPQWVMNMILNPREMKRENVQAQAMDAEYDADMVNTNLTEDEARAIVEYLRKY